MNRETLVRFFGGSPGGVIVRLVVLSFILGVVMNALGLSPFDIVSSFRRLVRQIYDAGFETVVWAWRYFLIGAVIVFPVWLVIRLVKLGGGRGRAKV
jgi:hypothetical protein